MKIKFKYRGMKLPVLILGWGVWKERENMKTKSKQFNQNLKKNTIRCILIKIKEYSLIDKNLNLKKGANTFCARCLKPLNDYKEKRVQYILIKIRKKSNKTLWLIKKLNLHPARLQRPLLLSNAVCAGPAIWTQYSENAIQSHQFFNISKVNTEK